MSHLYLLGGEVFGAFEYVAFGATLAPELVHLHHLSERDETDKRIGRE